MVELNCPFCQHRCRSDRLLASGTMVRCPACLRDFVYAGVQPVFAAPAVELEPSLTIDADSKRCPFCREWIKAEARRCRHCGEALDPVLRAADEARRSVEGRPIHSFSPGVARVLSVVWPGLGHIYRGRILSGIVWMIVTPLGYVCFIVPGLILHLLCIIFSGKMD
jgi:hypothetical protein